MAHDSDGFNRWDAAQTLMQRFLLASGGESGDGDSRVHSSTPSARALLEPSGDKALLAEVLTLPSEAYLGDQMAVVDVDGIHRARTTLGHAIGERLREPTARGLS